MSQYFFKGGRSDHKVRAFDYIRDRLTPSVADCCRYEEVGFNGTTSPSCLVLPGSGGYDSLVVHPSDVVAFDGVRPLNTKGLSALGMVERFVDATGSKLRGYENRSNQVEPDLLVSVSVFSWPSASQYGLLQGMLVRSFAADPRYASLRLDLCSGVDGRIFRPVTSAAYCKMHLCVDLLEGGQHDVYDVRFNPSLDCDENASSMYVLVSPDAFCAGRIVADLVRCAQDGPDPKWLPSDCDQPQPDQQKPRETWMGTWMWTAYHTKSSGR